MRFNRRTPGSGSRTGNGSGPRSETDRSRPFSARYRDRFGSGVMSLNLTPMIDIVFLLLFFFLTVSRFRDTEGMLPAHLPSQVATVSTEIPRTPIRIRLASDTAEPDLCAITIDRFGETPMPISELAARLVEIRDSQPGFDGDTPVFLIADDRIRWDHVVNAYNAVLMARYEKVLFTSGQES